MLSSPAKRTGAADVEAARHDQHRHRPPAETRPRKKPAKPEPVKTIVTAKRPRKRHYGEIIDDLPIRRTMKPRQNAPGRSSSVG